MHLYFCFSNLSFFLSFFFFFSSATERFDLQHWHSCCHHHLWAPFHIYVHMGGYFCLYVLCNGRTEEQIVYEHMERMVSLILLHGR